MKRTKITRVESWVNLGIPDCICALGDRFHLVELKVSSPKGKVNISPHQVAFHSAHKGFPTWVFVQHDKGRKARLFVYPGWQAYALAQYEILLPPALEQKYPWDWEEVEKYLTMFTF